MFFSKEKPWIRFLTHGLIAILYMASFFVRKTPWINSRLQQFFIPSSPWRNSKNQSLKPFWVTTLCTYILLSFHAKNIRSKVEAEVWRGLFEGCFLKGNSWCKLGSCTNMYLKSGHNTRNMVFHNGKKILFEVAFSTYMSFNEF